MICQSWRAASGNTRSAGNLQMRCFGHLHRYGLRGLHGLRLSTPHAASAPGVFSKDPPDALQLRWQFAGCGPIQWPTQPAEPRSAYTLVPNAPQVPPSELASTALPKHAINATASGAGTGWPSALTKCNRRFSLLGQFVSAGELGSSM